DGRGAVAAGRAAAANRQARPKGWARRPAAPAWQRAIRGRWQPRLAGYGSLSWLALRDAVGEVRPTGTGHRQVAHTDDAENRRLLVDGAAHDDVTAPHADV